MTTPSSNQGSPTSTEVPEPQGHLGAVPFDLRRPTVARFKSRIWNKNDSRLFPPKSIGMGWAINFYWLFHLRSYFKGHRTAH
jgi:hypothetical protein